MASRTSCQTLRSPQWAGSGQPHSAYPVRLTHPIGASGARVLVTLIYEMIRRDVHRGIAALCLGGGNAVAMAVER